MAGGAVFRGAGSRSARPAAFGPWTRRRAHGGIDSRTLRSTPESGPRADYDGAKRERGSKEHLAVDTLSHLLALHLTLADVGDRAAVARLAADVRKTMGDNVVLAFADQVHTGEAAAETAKALHVVKLSKAKRGFVLLDRRCRRWVVERSSTWATRCRGLVEHHERHAGYNRRLSSCRIYRIRAQECSRPVQDA